MHVQKASSALRCLWIARELPFPRKSGDRIYSSYLAEAFGAAGVLLTYIGLKNDGDADSTSINVKWIGVPGSKRSNWIAAFSRYPLVTAAHATPAIKRALDELLTESWDLIVLDHYGSAWALNRAVKFARASAHKVLIVHVSHNHEENLARALRNSNRKLTPRGLVLLMNLMKIKFWERRLSSVPEIVTTITDEDAKAYSQFSSYPRYITLTPGHSGSAAPDRQIDDKTPRDVVVIGSYRWGVKEQNLRRLIQEADELFFNNGITLHVIGDVPETLSSEFKGRLRATVLHGFVEDFAPYLTKSRIALVPEVVGGGFKLKFLDYIFGRIPIVTIKAASAGLPPELRLQLFQCVDMQELVACVVRHIDDLGRLNDMHKKAFEIASKRFSWSDRGSILLRSAYDLLSSS